MGSYFYIARYLKDIAPSLGLETAPSGLRLAGIALCHTAKVAQGRDLAEQMLRGDIPPLEDPQQELSRWIAERLLSPAELAIHEREGNRQTHLIDVASPRPNLSLKLTGRPAGVRRPEPCPGRPEA